MSFELPGAIEEVPVSSQVPAPVGIAETFGDIDHFRVEIADPLDLETVIQQRIHLYDAATFTDDERIHALALPFGNDPEDHAHEFFRRPEFLSPDKFQFLQEPELAVKVLKIIIDVRNVDEHSDGVFLMIREVNNALIHDRLHLPEHQQYLVF